MKNSALARRLGYARKGKRNERELFWHDHRASYHYRAKHF